MKLFSIIVLFFAAVLTASTASGQANATLNLLTLNSGQVNIGAVVEIQVTIGNTGPTASIGANKVRAAISVPPFVHILPNVDQTGVPSNWIITANSGTTISICNGSDVIAVGAQRQLFIKVRGMAVDGPSTINGNLFFQNGASCSVPGTLAGDNPADNTGTTSIKVNAVAPCNLAVTGSAGTITCNAGTTTLTATSTGANGGVEYSLNGGSFQSSNTFTVTAGTHTVTAREVANNSCTATSSSVIVTDPAITPAPIINIVQPTCTVSTGTVIVTSSTAGLTFSLDNGAFAVYPAGGYILPVGNHTLRSQNGSGCISAIATIDIDAGGIAPVAPTATIVHPTCTVATGTITITSSTTGLTFSLDGGAYAAYPTGGYAVAAGAHTITAQNASSCLSTPTNVVVNAQPPVPIAPVAGTVTQPTCAVSTGSIELTGLPAGSWTINPGGINGNTTTFTINNLDPGTYNYTVTNSAGCTSTVSPNIAINNVPGAPTAPIVTLTQPSCTVANGNITITSTTTGLTFSIDGTNYAAYPAGGYNVAAGSYNITAQNSSGCISAVTHITINAQPPSPVRPDVNVIQPTCQVPTGTINITSSTTGLTFSLNGGPYAAYPAGGYTAITAGPHTIIAQNSNSCLSPIVNITVNAAPSSPAGTASQGTINCAGQATSLTVTATGGTAPYQYSIDGGVNFQTSNVITGVPAGTYSIIIMDAGNCTGTIASVVVTGPAPITATSSAAAPVPCSATTSFTVTTTGGVAPLQYSLDAGAYQSNNIFNVGSGSHTVTVKDANNCTVTTSAVIVAIPNSVVVSATAQRIATCGGKSQIVVTATGGTAPYAIGTGTFTRAPGTWDFEVTDAAGCKGHKEVIIEAPGCMDIYAVPNPARTGNITINHSIASPGSRMQVFEINGALVMTKSVPQDAFITTLDISKLAAATYMIVFMNGEERKATLFVKSN